MRVPRNLYLSIGLTVLGIGAIGYQALNYSGLYRLMSDLQIRFLGFYLPLISIAPLLICLVPGQLVAPDRAREEEALEDRFATFEGLALYKQQRTLSRLLYWIPVAAIAAAAAFLIGLTQSATPLAPVPVDIATIGESRPPIGVPVTLIGTPDVDHVGTISMAGRSGADENAVPFAAPPASRGYRYFVGLGHSDLEARDRLSGLIRTGRVEGTLSENGLPGEMRALFERDRLPIAEPHYYLGPTWPPPRVMLMRWATVLLGLAAFLGLVALNAWRLIRKLRREMAE